MSPKSKDRKLVISCGCVVHRIDQFSGERQLLLIKQFNDQDIWGIPKGRMNPGETFEQCAIRETREETGINVEIQQPLPKVHLQLKNKDKTVISYIARQTCQNIPRADDPDSEVADVAWFNIKNLPPLQAYQTGVIFEALEILKNSQ
jgi:ADP-ribose pyrophosphatase YjhB (NUDIX family)